MAKLFNELRQMSGAMGTKNRMRMHINKNKYPITKKSIND